MQIDRQGQRWVLQDRLAWTGRAQRPARVLQSRQGALVVRWANQEVDVGGDAVVFLTVDVVEQPPPLQHNGGESAGSQHLAGAIEGSLNGHSLHKYARFNHRPLPHSIGDADQPCG